MWRVAGEPDVGQHEGLVVRAALEPDAGLLAHDAVNAVRADGVAGADDRTVVECRGHPMGVLLDRGNGLRPQHGTAEFLEALEQ